MSTAALGKLLEGLFAAKKITTPLVKQFTAPDYQAVLDALTEGVGGGDGQAAE
jgi:hypothetical protein